MEKKKDIKIFVSHRIDLDSETIDNPLFVPVRCGAVFDKRENVTMLGDNTGDNISEKRMSFCELTVQYWAWKNVEADYYGLCHYRRYFSFSDKKLNNYNNLGLLCDSTLGKKHKYFLDDEVHMRKLITKYDLLLPEYMDIRKVNTPKGKKNSVLEHWMAFDSYFIDKNLINKILEFIKEYNTDIYKYALKYLNGNKYRGYNCYIMKKIYFIGLCDFQFNILFKVENIMNTKYYSSTMKRSCGFFGEILFGIYCYYLEHTANLKIKQNQLVFFNNTKKEKDLYVAFKEANIPIVITNVNNYTVQNLGVILKSIEKNISMFVNYDIIIFETDISEENQSLLINEIKNNKNMKIRFYNPTRKMDGIDFIQENGDKYYKVFTPWLLPNYNKIILLDCNNIIINTDINDLFNIKLNNYMVGAVKDIVLEGVLNSPDKKDWYEHCTKTIELDNPYEYIDSSLMLLNLNNIRKNFLLQDIINLIRNKHNECDILNMLFSNKIKFLDYKWSFKVDANIYNKKYYTMIPADSEKKYLEAKKNPLIINYTGHPKPWEEPSLEFANIFWNMARNSIYYEQLISRLAYQYSCIHETKYHRNIFFNLISQSGKQKIKNFIKVFLPKGTKRHRFVKKAYFKLRGWPFVE